MPTLMHVDVNTRLVVAAVQLLPHALLVSCVLSQWQLELPVFTTAAAEEATVMGYQASARLLLALLAATFLSSIGLSLSFICEAYLRRHFLSHHSHTESTGSLAPSSSAGAAVAGPSAPTGAALTFPASAASTSSSFPAGSTPAASRTAPALGLSVPAAVGPAASPHGSSARGSSTWSPARASPMQRTATAPIPATTSSPVLRPGLLPTAEEAMQLAAPASGGIHSVSSEWSELLPRSGSAPGAQLRHRTRRSGMLLLPEQHSPQQP